MGHHILHLVGPHLRARLRLEQLYIADTAAGTERSVPLEDVALVVAATPDLTVTGAVLRRMAELNIPLLVCDERFAPVSLTLPYYRCTETGTLRGQLAWTAEWKDAVWRRVIAAKIQNQAFVLREKRPRELLQAIAAQCAASEAPEDERKAIPISRVSRPHRGAGLYSDRATACEARAARHYWKHLLPRLDGDAKRREPGTRDGVNALLDYGYAVLRSAVLRSLAAHGFIAAIGIHHAMRACSYALADDLMEPLRPWCDRALRDYVGGGGEATVQAWAPTAAGVLMETVAMRRQRVRLLHGIDTYIRSVAEATRRGSAAPLSVPLLS
jgi:CRISPR-associated protein Cas1